MDFPDISLSYVQQQTVSGPLKCILGINDSPKGYNISFPTQRHLDLSSMQEVCHMNLV